MPHPIGRRAGFSTDPDSSIEPPRTRQRLPAVQTLLILAEVFIAATLIIFVMLQRSEGGALGMGGGGSGLGGLFSPRGAADTLTRTTAILAALFFLTCIGLNLFSLKGRNEKSILDSPVTTNVPGPAPVRPALPSRTPQVPSVPTPH